MYRNLDHHLQTLIFDGKQTEMIDLIQQNSTYKFDFNYALYFASYGHKEIFKCLIETYHANNFTIALFWACLQRQKEIAEWLINNYPIDYTKLIDDEKIWLKEQNILTQIVIVSD